VTARRSLRAFFAALLLTQAGLAAAVPAPAQTNPGMTAAWSFPGVYRTTRQGADSIQALTLTLGRDGSAQLTTTYPGYTMTAAGVRVYPYVEMGTWRRVQSLARVRFTQSGQLIDGRLKRVHADTTEYWFRNAGCALHLSPELRHPSKAGGRTFRKVDCRG
jgi:hypothetical protein